MPIFLLSTQGHSEPERTVYPKHLDEKSGADYDYQNRKKARFISSSLYPSYHKFEPLSTCDLETVLPGKKVQVGIPLVWFYNFLKSRTPHQVTGLVEKLF